MKSLLRWIGMALAGLAALVVVVLAAAAIVLRTAWFHDWIRREATRRASSVIAGELSIGAVSGSLLHDVTLHDVTIRQDGAPVVSLAAVSVSYVPIELVHHDVVLTDVTITQPAIVAKQGPDGWNLARLIRSRASTSGGAPWRVSVGRVRVTGGAATIEPAGSRARRLGGIALDASLTYDDRRLTAHVRTLAAADLDTGVGATLVVDSCVADADGVKVNGVSIATAATDVHAHAAYDLRTHAVDATLDVAPLTLREFDAYLPAAVPRDLIVNGRAQATGRLDALHVSWTTTSQGGLINGDVTADLAHAPIAIQGRVDVTNLELAALTGQKALASAITAQADLDGAIDTAAPARSRVSFTIQAPALMVATYRAANVRARGAIAASTVTADGTGAAYGASASFSARVGGLGSGAMRIGIDGAAHDIDLEKLPAAWHVPALATDISGRYAVTLGPHVTRASLTTEASRVADATIDAGTVATVALTGARLEATVDGRVQHLSGELLHLPLAGRTSLNGSVNARIAIADLAHPTSLDGLEGTAAVSLGQSTIQNAAIDRADVDASIAAGTVHVDKLDVTGASIDASVQGVVALAGPAGSSDLTYRIDAPDLASLSAFGLSGLGGSAHVEGRIQGPSSRLTTTGTFAGQELKYKDVVDTVTLNGTFTGTLPDRNVAALTASADLKSVLLKVRSSNIQQLTVHADYGAKRVDLVAHVEQPARTIDVRGSLAFGVTPREIHLQAFTLAGPGAPWTLDTGGKDVVIRYGTDAIAISNLALVSGPARVEAAGTIALTPAGVTRTPFQARFSGVDVASVYQLALGRSPVVGTASGSISLGGPIAALDARAALSVANARVANIALSNVSANVALQHQRAAIDAHIDETSGSALDVQGTVPIAATAGPIDLRVRSSGVDLALAEAFTSQVQHIRGQATLDLHVAGALASPSVTGHVGIANAGFLVAATGVTYQNLAADVQFDGTRAAINRFTVQDDDGHVLTASGAGDVLSPSRAIDITVHSDGMHLLNNEFGVLEVKTDLHATGQVAAPNVTGTVVVTRGVVQADRVLQTLTTPSEAVPPPEPTPGTGSIGPASAGTSAPAAGAPPAQATSAAASSVPASTGGASATAAGSATAAPATAGSPAEAPHAAAATSSTGVFSRATLAITLDMNDSLLIRGSDLRTATGSMGLGDVNLTIGGKIQVAKTAGADLGLVGALTAVRGSYTFEGRRFTVTRGSSVTFHGERPIDPRLDVTGTRNVSGVTANVHVTGTARRPRLDLSSSPPLDQSDVLALIIFNEPVEQLGDAEQSSLAQRAGLLAASAVATPLANSIGRALDLDTFEILTPSGNEAGEVNVGHQVSDRLYVGFRQEFGSSDASRLSFEYRLTDTLQVMTSFGQGTDQTKDIRENEAAGIDLLFTTRY